MARAAVHFLLFHEHCSCVQARYFEPRKARKRFIHLHRFDLYCINLSICTSSAFGWGRGVVTNNTPTQRGHYRCDEDTPGHTFISIQEKRRHPDEVGLSLGLSVMDFFPVFFYLSLFSLLQRQGCIHTNTFPPLTLPSSSSSTFCLCCAMSRLITPRQLSGWNRCIQPAASSVSTLHNYTKLHQTTKTGHVHTWIHTVVVGATIWLLFIFFDSFSPFLGFPPFPCCRRRNYFSSLVLALFFALTCSLSPPSKNYFFGYVISSLSSSLC